MSWSIDLTRKVALKQGTGITLPLESITDEMKTRLTAAARAAPIMAAAAITYLNKIGPNTAGKDDAISRELKHTLIKYFNLYPDNKRFVSIAQRIVGVYRAIHGGLSGGYPLYVYCLPRTEQSFRHGEVEVHKKAHIGLGQFFAADDSRHWKWDEVKEAARKQAPGFDRELSGEIHLNYEWFKNPAIAMDMIATTIVHEASHKWAYTVDVCYKSSTVSKIQTADGLLDAVRMGFQPAVERQDKGPLYPMTKPGKKVAPFPNSFNADQTDMWVKNADSYAWAARRLWKRVETFSSLIEYPTKEEAAAVSAGARVG